MKTVAIYEQLSGTVRLMRSDLERLRLLREAALRNFPKARVLDYVDRRVKTLAFRPELRRLLADCQRCEVDGVVFGGFASVAEGIQRVVYLVSALSRLDKPFLFVDEGWDSREDSGKAVAKFFSDLCAVDRRWAKLADRQVPGRKSKRNERAKRLEKARGLIGKGWSLRKVAKRTGVPLASLHSYLKDPPRLPSVMEIALAHPTRGKRTDNERNACKVASAEDAKT